MTEPLDLGPLNAALDRLVGNLTGDPAGDVLLAGGEQFAERWRSNIVAAGEVDTGAYLGSIRAELDTSGDEATVQVCTDLEESYPAILEYGSFEISPRPVATQAYDNTRDGATDQVAEKLGDLAREAAR